MLLLEVVAVLVRLLEGAMLLLEVVAVLVRRAADLPPAPLHRALTLLHQPVPLEAYLLARRLQLPRLLAEGGAMELVAAQLV